MLLYFAHILDYAKVNFFVKYFFKDALSRLRQFLTIENPLRMMIILLKLKLKFTL